MKLHIAALALTLMSTPTLANDLPRFNVDQQCDEIANFGGSYSEMTKQGCMQMEQQAYNQLKPTWGSLPDAMQTQCLEIASFGGPGSYSTLQGCIQMEQNAAATNRNTEFKY